MSDVMEQVERNIEKFRKGNAELVLKDKNGKLKNTKVKIEQVRHKFLFGCAMDLLNGEIGEVYIQRFAELFNYVTTENVLKWSNLEPKEGKKFYDRVDKIVKACAENNVKLKGHTLAWGHPSGVPLWLEKYPVKKIERLQLNRIKEILHKYKGKIEFYEIVNEPTYALKFNAIGIANFTEKCMRVAEKADPRAYFIVNGNKLFISEDGKREFFGFLKRLIKEKIKFKGIGIQDHLPHTIWRSPKELWDMLDYFSRLGKDLHITEFMVRTKNEDGSYVDITGNYREGKWSDEKQAEYYKEVYTLCFGHPRVKAITTWGLSDDRNRLPGSGLLDKNLEPKTVYKMLKELIHSKWNTKITAETDAKGLVRFRGFYGDYVASTGGRKAAFKLDKNNQKIEIKI